MAAAILREIRRRAGSGQEVWSPTVAKLLVWGGAVSGTDVDDGAIYSPGSDSWAMMPAGPLAARNSHVVVWSGTDVVIWGGRQGDKDFQRDGARYDPSGKTWTSLPAIPSAWADRLASPWLGLNGGFGIFGGLQIAPGFPVFGDSLLLSSTNKWTLFPPPASSAVSPATHVMGANWSDGLRVWVWGGSSDVASSTASNTGIVLDLAAGAWSAMSSASPLSARVLPAAVWTGTNAIVWGGQAASKLRDGAIFVP
jgi:hypothetical protein